MGQAGCLGSTVTLLRPGNPVGAAVLRVAHGPEFFEPCNDKLCE